MTEELKSKYETITVLLFKMAPTLLYCLSVELDTAQKKVKLKTKLQYNANDYQGVLQFKLKQ